MTHHDQYAAVRYLVDDVQAAVDFYTAHLGFEVRTSAAPAFADVVRGPLRLLLSGAASSGARATPPDARSPGGNRIHLIVDDLDTEIARIRAIREASCAAASVGPVALRAVVAAFATSPCAVAMACSASSSARRRCASAWVR